MQEIEKELLKKVAIYKVALFDACEDVAMLLNAEDVCDDEIMVNKLYEKYKRRAARSLSERGECCGKACGDKE